MRRMFATFHPPGVLTSSWLNTGRGPRRSPPRLARSAPFRYTRIPVNQRFDPMATDVTRPTFVEVSLARLAENFRAIQAAVAPAVVMPILKANAYGHGLVPVARHLVTLGATSLGVAFLEEAVALRDAGLTLPILVMGGILGNQIPAFLRHGLTLTASSIDKLRQIDAAAGSWASPQPCTSRSTRAWNGSASITTPRTACWSARRSAGA